MTKIFHRLKRDEGGATAIEYGLIAALVSAALIAGASTLGNTLDSALSKIGSSIATSGKI
ncbi:Flp family type IVb pilin [Ensifer sp. 22521]|uniref:Flp family type IVb pilin n=1 Tax=unclassified Ensifer TaxID=2633371 RepID=UPI000DA01BE0